MRKIIIPTDFSESARNAMQYAVSVFGTANTEYLLINSYYEPTSSADSLVSLHDLMLKDSKAGLEKEMDYFSSLGQSIKVDSKTVYGNLENVINNLSETGVFHFVVMGTDGASGLKKHLIGSNASNVIKECKLPVITVPGSYKGRSINTIALACDNEKLEHPQHLEVFKKLAEEHKAEISIVNVSKEESNDLPECVKYYDLSGEVKVDYVVSESVVDGLISYTSDKPDGNLLVMVGRDKGFFKKLFKGSSTQNMSMETNTPLLIIKD